MTGGNQRNTKKSKMEEMVGRMVEVNFVFGAGETLRLVDTIAKRENIRNSRYFLKTNGISLPLKYLNFNGYDKGFGVQVPAGSYTSLQLNRLVQLD